MTDYIWGSEVSDSAEEEDDRELISVLDLSDEDDDIDLISGAPCPETINHLRKIPIDFLLTSTIPETLTPSNGDPSILLVSVAGAVDDEGGGKQKGDECEKVKPSPVRVFNSSYLIPIKPILQPITNPISMEQEAKPSPSTFFKYIKRIFWSRAHQTTETTSDSIVPSSLPTPISAISNQSIVGDSVGDGDKLRQRKLVHRRTQSLRKHKYLVKQKRIIRLANSSSSDYSSSEEVDGADDDSWRKLRNTTIPNSDPMTPTSDTNKYNITSDDIVSLSESEEPKWPGMFSQV